MIEIIPFYNKVTQQQMFCFSRIREKNIERKKISLSYDVFSS